MSGIAAAIAAASPNTARVLVDRMLDAMRERGPDGRGVSDDLASALGVVWRTADPEDRAQPFVDAVAGVTVVVDGRVDNRSEIAAATGLVRHRELPSDAEAVGAAYARWGVDGIARLLGEFAGLIWDSRQRRLVAVRDIFGTRPLCYARAADGGWLVASEVRALLAAGVSAAVNEARALEVLVDRRHDLTETLYTSILRVPPAHVLVMARGGLRTQRYWDLPTGTIRSRDPREYGAQVRDLLSMAIRDRSRGRRVGVLLSGGIDSSSVAVIGTAAGVECETFSLHVPGEATDEFAYAQDVARTAGLRAHVLPYAPVPTSWYRAQAATYRDLPDHPNGAMFETIRAAARARGITTLLTGYGGDDWFTGSGFVHADLLRSGALLASLSQLRADAAAWGTLPALRSFVRRGLWPLLPSPVAQGIKAARHAIARPDPLPPWIDPAAARRTALVDRVRSTVVRRPGETFSQAEIRLINSQGALALSDELEDRAANRGRIEQRNPFYDRRVVEFAFRLPESQRGCGPRRKIALREAGRGLLPPRVHQRPDKAEFSSLFRDALTRADGGVPRLLERGWVVRSQVEAIGNRLRHAVHEVSSVDLAQYWMLYALEWWLETLSRRIDVRGIEADDRIGRRVAGSRAAGAQAL